MREQTRPVTLHSVAKQAGVSAMTVSRVVNHSSSVTEETRKRVLKAIKETGYRVPPVEQRFRSALRRKQRIRTGNIGLVFPDTNAASMRTSLAAELIHGVEEAAQEAGLSLMVGHLRGRKGVPGFLSERNVDGVIVRGGGGGLLPDPIRKVVSDLPHVTLLGLYPGLGSTGDYVQPDDEAVGMQAAMLAHQEGVRDLVILNFDSGNLSFQTRRDACLRSGNLLGLHTTVLESPLAEGAKVVQAFAGYTGRVQGCFSCGCTGQVEERSLEDAFISLGFVREKGKTPILSLYINSAEFRHPSKFFLLDLRIPYLGRLAVAQLLRRIQSPGHPFCRIAIEPILLR